MSRGQPDEDARLMLAFQAGDRGAFEDLFARYTHPLIGFLSRMVPDRGRAEELAQEVFVRVYGAKERYEPRAKFSTWIFGIAHNLALNELGLKADEVVMIGDDIVSDVGGAQNAGIKGILVKTGKYREEIAEKSQVTPDGIIDSIFDLKSILTSR